MNAMNVACYISDMLQQLRNTNTLCAIKLPQQFNQ